MVRKIGEIVIVFSLGICATNYAQSCTISLSVHDKKGQSITQAQAGIPFYLTASVSGKSRNLPAPTLTGIDRAYIKGESTSQDIRMINGDLTARCNYTYTVLIDKEGDYTFGPAQCTSDNKTLSSDTIEVSVKHKTEVEVDKNKTAFATLFFNKKEVWYQEPTECFIRFYYSLDGIHLHEMSEPQFNDAVAEQFSQPRSGVETIDGLNYRYLEWKTTIYPNTIGTLTLAPVIMRYTEPQKMNGMSAGSLFSNLFDMMSGFEEQRELYTNSAQLHVKALPESQDFVKAVGNYKSLELQLNTTTVNVGEGIIVSLKVVGEGNLFALSHPLLTLPDNCTFYEGNATYKNDIEPACKIFEYVVQATTPGTYVIPEQNFTYFDLETQTYKSIQSKATRITITGTVATKNSEEDTTSRVTDVFKEVEWKPVFLKGVWYQQKRFMISWLVFFLLALIPLLAFLTIVLGRMYKNYYDRTLVKRRYETAFKSTRKQLEIARRKKQYSYVYSIFMHMFADRFQVDVRTLSESVIEERLQKLLSQEQVIQWRLFYVYMNETAFAYTSFESDGIFTQAFAWVSLLERIL